MADCRRETEHGGCRCTESRARQEASRELTDIYVDGDAHSPIGSRVGCSFPPDSACSLWAWTCCAEHFHSVARLKRRRKDRLSCVSPRAVRPARRYRVRLETATYPAWSARLAHGYSPPAPADAGLYHDRQARFRYSPLSTVFRSGRRRALLS